MIKTNCIEIIYLQLYKDTHLIFMQAFEPLQGILNYFKTLKKIKCIFEILRYLLIVKLKSYQRTDHKNEAYYYKWTFRKRENNFI